VRPRPTLAAVDEGEADEDEAQRSWQADPHHRLPPEHLNSFLPLFFNPQTRITISYLNSPQIKGKLLETIYLG
jgi:hypothetical protein